MYENVQYCYKNDLCLSSYAEACTPATLRPLQSANFWKDASHNTATAVEQATLGPATWDLPEKN
jgi:hypothetical protein